MRRSRDAPASGADGVRWPVIVEQMVLAAEARAEERLHRRHHRRCRLYRAKRRKRDAAHHLPTDQPNDDQRSIFGFWCERILIERGSAGEAGSTIFAASS